jgi:hypothetical protein
MPCLLHGTAEMRVLSMSLGFCAMRGGDLSWFIAKSRGLSDLQ